MSNCKRPTRERRGGGGNYCEHFQPHCVYRAQSFPLQWLAGQPGQFCGLIREFFSCQNVKSDGSKSRLQQICQGFGQLGQLCARRHIPHLQRGAVPSKTRGTGNEKDSAGGPGIPQQPDFPQREQPRVKLRIAP